jgi:hypothetical protein
MKQSTKESSLFLRAAEGVGKGADRLHNWGLVLKPCRFSLVTVLGGLFILLFVPQGQDLLRGLAERISGTRTDSALRFFFFLSAFFWAFSAWYWSSVMLRLRFPGLPGNEPAYHTVRTWIPRCLGCAALLGLSAALLRASFGYENPEDGARLLLQRYALGTLVVAGLFFITVARRRGWMNAAYRRLHSLALFQNRRTPPLLEFLNIIPAREIVFGASSVRDLPRAMKVVTALTLMTEELLFLLFWLNPVQAAPVLGAAAILLLAAAGWTAAGSLLDAIGLRLRFPVLPVFLILVLLFSGWNDNHAVRTLPAPPQPWENRRTLKQSLTAWLAHQEQHPSPDQAYPLFIVAAEGGGIRAAYWTAVVLARIRDLNPAFPDHLFAVSSVSGGSLGSAVFLAQLAQTPFSPQGFFSGPSGARLPGARDFLPTARGVLSRDFLSPVVGAMLYPDFVQQLLPWPVTGFDRARVLEEAWERAWNGQTGSNQFSRPFDELWQQGDRRWLPGLILNSTWVETGKRLIISNMRLLPADFNDIEDLHRFYKQESLPLSTAVHLSARFTYISPAGTLKKEGRTCGRAVDGGYFENSGETAVIEILQAIDNLAEEDGAWKKVIPVVIHISNEPVDPRYGQTTLETAPDRRSTRPDRFLNEIRSPVKTLLNTRDARAVYARETARNYVSAENFIHFGLCRESMGFPLGWVLSETVQAQIENQLARPACPAFDNPKNLERIQSFLNLRFKRKEP